MEYKCNNCGRIWSASGTVYCCPSCGNKTKIVNLTASQSHAGNSYNFNTSSNKLERAKEKLFQKDYYEAFKDLSACANEGVPEACYYLGILYDDFGHGLRCDKKQAEKLYRKAYEGGYLPAAASLAQRIYDTLDDQGVAQKEIIKRIYPFLKDALKKGNQGSAKAFLAYIEFLEEAEKEGATSEIKDKLGAELDDILKNASMTDSERDFVSLMSAMFSIHSVCPEDRYWGFNTLVLLAENWDSSIAVPAANYVAECYRDGLFVYQDSEKAEEYYKKSADHRTENGDKELKEFRSGEWQNIPDDEVPAWCENKLIECILKIKDDIYLAKRPWNVASEIPEMRKAVEEFSVSKAIQSVRGDIEMMDRFAEKVYDRVPDTFESASRRDLGRLEDTLEEFYEVLQDYIRHFDKFGYDKERDWTDDAIDIGKNFVKGCLMPDKAIWEVLTGNTEVEKQIRARKRELGDLNHDIEKAVDRINRAQKNLIDALLENLEDIQKDNSK